LLFDNCIVFSLPSLQVTIFREMYKRGVESDKSDKIRRSSFVVEKSNN